MSPHTQGYPHASGDVRSGARQPQRASTGQNEGPRNTGNVLFSRSPLASRQWNPSTVDTLGTW